MLASDNPEDPVSIRPRLDQILRPLLVVVAPLIDVMALPQLGLAWETADFSGPVPPGMIVINTMERKLFFVLGEASVIRYPKHDRRAWVAADHVGSVRRSFATRF